VFFRGQSNQSVLIRVLPWPIQSIRVDPCFSVVNPMNPC
jgi:hypothetical protein